MTAAKKWPAPLAGRGGASSGKYLSSNNIQQTATAVKLDLPSWMAEKLASIAARVDVWQLEQEQNAILASMLRCYPKQAEKLPNSFRDKIILQKPRELEPLHRASVIIAAYDWKDVADVFGEATPEEKAAATFDALSFALREGGGI